MRRFLSSGSNLIAANILMDSADGAGNTFCACRTKRQNKQSRQSNQLWTPNGDTTVAVDIGYPAKVGKGEDTEDRSRRIGLCYDCLHAQRIQSDRGSIFYRCKLSDTDPNFPKYPRLPVLRCDGYKKGAGGS